MTYKPFYKVRDEVKILPFVNIDMEDYACNRYVSGDTATIKEIYTGKEHDDYEYGLMGETCLYQLTLHNPREVGYDYGYAFESMIAPINATEIQDLKSVYDITGKNRKVFRTIGQHKGENLYCVFDGSKLETITGYMIDL